MLRCSAVTIVPSAGGPPICIAKPGKPIMRPRGRLKSLPTRATKTTKFQVPETFLPAKKWSIAQLQPTSQLRCPADARASNPDRCTCPLRVVCVGARGWHTARARLSRIICHNPEIPSWSAQSKYKTSNNRDLLGSLAPDAVPPPSRASLSGLPSIIRLSRMSSP